MAELKAELNQHRDAPKSKALYYISLPTVESHQGHPTGEGVAGFTQRINEKVAQKIAEIDTPSPLCDARGYMQGKCTRSQR